MPAHATAAAFPATRWSMVLSARDAGHVAGGRAAMEDLCRTYWQPLYAFARRWGLRPEDAADRTQEFFADVIWEQQLLHAAQPGQGKLRTFLLTAFQRDLLDARRTENRQRRGGGMVVSLDCETAERHLSAASDNLSPESLYEKDWAATVLRASLGLVAQRYAEEDKADLFAALKPFISADEEAGADYEAASLRTGLSRPAVRQAVHRLRERFRDALRAHIADTLEAPTESQIDDELLALQKALIG